MYRFSRKNLKTKGDTNLRKSVGWRTFKVLAFWSEGKWQAQFLKLVPPLALLKALYSILKTASWVGQKIDNIGKYLRCAEKIPKFFLA